MQAGTNYIYIIFALAYVVYSIVQASKKVQQNRPKIDKRVAKDDTQRQPAPTVQPPTASPVPNPGDEMKKMLEDIFGERENIPASPLPEERGMRGEAKPQPPKAVTHAKPRKYSGERVVPSKISSKTQKAENPFLPSEPHAAKESFEEQVLVAEETDIDFDIRQAVIYSEILKRPEY